MLRGKHAAEESLATAASIGGAYRGGKERKRRHQFIDTAAAVGERNYPSAAPHMRRHFCAVRIFADEKNYDLPRDSSKSCCSYEYWLEMAN